MFVCADCYDEKLYYYSKTPLSKVGSCDKCDDVRYVERVYKFKILNLIYDKRLKCILCPTCYGPANYNKDGDLQCEWDLCNSLFTVFIENKHIQMEFNF